MRLHIAIAILAGASLAQADYRVSVVKTGLAKPTGLTVQRYFFGNVVFFTQVPTPGVPGSQGGMNSVDLLLPNGQVFNINRGEPEPVNITLARDGSLYWTCKSAGVILERSNDGTIAPLLTGLAKPNGITAARDGDIYFTQVPTPGVPGSMGGMNTVNLFDGSSILELTRGEPEPTDIAVDNRTGTAYWTCKSAGVILKRDSGGNVSLFLRGLNKPTGISIGRRGQLVFSEVPTPGVPGVMGGGNFVWSVDIDTRAREIVHFGDPEPTDVAISQDGTIYWTCTSAGVIVKAVPRH
ncbi:MAG: hypothetical protein AB7F50_02800 [Fimbriimonadaceae bacterium]